jgi:hypothetical protein
MKGENEMSLAGKSLCLLTPMYNNQLFMNYHESVIELVSLAARSGMKSFSYVNVATSLIALSRNLLVSKFLEGDGTHCVFIDADMGFDPHDVLKMLELDRDVIGACCPVKSFFWSRMQQMCRRSGREFTEQEMQQLGGTFNYEKPVGEKMRLDVPQEVRRLGSGLLMVKREVFEKLRQAHPDRWYEPRDLNGAPMFGGVRIHEFFRTGLMSGHEYIGCDYTFCDECTALGLKIWMCPWTKTTHMGTHAFVGDLPGIASLCGESAPAR